MAQDVNIRSFIIIEPTFKILLRSCIFFNICYLILLCLATRYAFTLKTPSVFRNSESESSINPQTCCIENEWPNFDKDVIAMDEEEWNKNDMKEFTRQIE